MNIEIFFNSITAPQAASAFVWAKFYGGRVDSAGNNNSVAIHDVRGLSDAQIDAITYTVGASHRIVNFCVTGAGAGQVSNPQIAYLKTKLITKTIDPLSDDDVVTITPSGGDGKSICQIAWNAIWNSKLDPLAHGTASAGGNTTLTDVGASMVADAYADCYIQIISGTGIGQIRKIASNTTTVFTVPTWTINPDTTSVYVVSGNLPRPYPTYIQWQSADAVVDGGTASSGDDVRLTDNTKTWVGSAFVGKYIAIIDGTGSGQYAKIISNTGQDIGVTAWIPTNDALPYNAATGSIYIILDRLDELWYYPSIKIYAATYLCDLELPKAIKIYQALTDCYDNIFNQAPDGQVATDPYVWEEVLKEGRIMLDYFMKK